MAGFLYSYRQCTSRNLQNIYSGNDRAPVMYLKEKKIDRFLERRKIFKESLPNTKKDYVKNKYDKRLHYYDKDLGTRMPKAPAFREANSDTVYEIVERLHRPDTAHVFHKRQQPSEYATRRINSASSTGSRLSAKDVNLIFARLHVSHTHVSRLKCARGLQESTVCQTKTQKVK